MVNDIKTVNQLKLEILRRKTLSDTLKSTISSDFKELKESLKPMNLAKNAISNKTVATTALASTAFASLIFAARKTILKNTKGLANSALSFILPKIASTIASQASSTIFSKIKDAFRQN